MRILRIAAAWAIGCGLGCAQPFLSGGASSARPTGAEARPANARGHSWVWVHTGIAVQAAGSFADWATSWKQPEGNQWLAEGSGRYAGKFYRSGAVHKAELSLGLAAVSYLIAWKWPALRRYVGVFNLSVGLAQAGVAVSNTIQNPYYKP